MEMLLARIDAARKEGLPIRANMYTYIAGGTGLDACLPPWTQDGGYSELLKRLRDPEIRKKIAAEVKVDSDKWENIYLGAGSPERIVVSDFTSDTLKPFTDNSLDENARIS